MQSGAFVILSIFEKNEQSNLEIKNFAGLSKTHPVLAAMMSIFMLSLAGIPPFAGFFGKYYLFVAAVNSGFTWLTIIAVIASIVSMYYYIGLILSMYFKENEADEMTGTTGLAAISIFIAIGGLLLFGLFPSLITEITKAFF
jgi:NADH-quinone oxidoreductase subunit N